MTRQIFKKNQIIQFTHGHQAIMCLNGDKVEHHRIGNNLGIRPNLKKQTKKRFKTQVSTYPMTSHGTMVKSCSFHPVKKIPRKLGIKGFMMMMQILKNTQQKANFTYIFFHRWQSFPLTIKKKVILRYQFKKEILTVSGLDVLLVILHTGAEPLQSKICCHICFNRY